MIGWPADWVTPEQTVAEALRRRLKLEVGEGHVLWGKVQTCQIIARNYRDDVFAALEDGRFAHVHLSYSSRANPPPRPVTTIYSSLEAWRRDEDQMWADIQSDQD